METIVVNVGKYSYPVIIGVGLLNNPTSFSLLLKPGDKTMIITNETLAPLYIHKIYYLLKQINVSMDSIILPDGEQYKNLTTLNKIINTLLQNLYGRDAILIALGGGVIGDLTGFVAAIYQRGIRFIQIPTTLLSQVDAAIGGKTAVNHLFGKNMIGAFWHPILVIIDLECLKTLSHRELISGFAEVIKYSIITDSIFFSWLEKNIDALLCLHESSIFYCVYHCCILKAKIVSTDARDTSIRSLLNFGHTYAHAIEIEMGYGSWLHGEAVAAGIVMATYTSERLGIFKKEDTQRIITLLKRAGLPISGPKEMSAQSYLYHMIRDKKVLAGKIRLILPIAIGRSIIYDKVSYEVILNAISDCQYLK